MHHVSPGEPARPSCLVPHGFPHELITNWFLTIQPYVPPIESSEVPCRAPPSPAFHARSPPRCRARSFLPTACFSRAGTTSVTAGVNEDVGPIFRRLIKPDDSYYTPVHAQRDGARRKARGDVAVASTSPEAGTCGDAREAGQTRVGRRARNKSATESKVRGLSRSRITVN